MARDTATLDAVDQDFAVSDLPDVDGGDASTPTPQPSGERTSEQIAELPDVKAAFERVFGSSTAEAPAQTPKKAGTTRTKRQRDVEAADELDGLDGVTEADDEVEPDGDDATPADHEVSERSPDGTSPDDQPKAGDEEGADDAPTLAPNLLLAAKRAGWNDDDVAEFVKANPELAEKTFKKLLTSFNDVSAEYGRLGSQAVGFDPQQPPPTQRVGPQGPATGLPPQGFPQQQQQQPQGDLLSEIYGDRMEVLSTAYGPDFLKDVVQPLVTQLVAPLQELQNEARLAKMEATGREVGQFWQGLPKEFSKLYGTGTDVGGPQLENRTKCGQMADQIRTGALRQGIDLSVGECLERANLMLSSEFTAQIEREKITASVQKRSRQISQRPSQRKRAVPAAGEKSDKAAMDAYAERATELGINV